MMYEVMLFHDVFRSCAKHEKFTQLSDALAYLSQRVAKDGEYESAMVYHTSICILMYSRTGEGL